MNNQKTKAIAYAFPSSPNAVALGFAKTGCWHIQETVYNIEGSGQCRTYLPHDAEGFDQPDHPDLIDLYNETRAEADPSFAAYGDERAKLAINIANQNHWIENED